MTSRQSYGLIDLNRIAYVHIVGMQSKCIYADGFYRKVLTNLTWVGKK